MNTNQVDAMIHEAEAAGIVERIDITDDDDAEDSVVWDYGVASSATPVVFPDVPATDLDGNPIYEA